MMENLMSIVLNEKKRYNGDLVHYFRLVMNAPNAFAPYHNVRHMLHVTWEAYDAAIFYELDKTETRILLTAAMVHDLGHLCGAGKNDDDNISMSKKMLTENVLPEDAVYLPILMYLLDMTRYPYKDVEPPNIRTELVGKIIRDCDQSQTFSNAWIQSIMYGLSSEMQISPIKMLQMQVPFLQNLKFFTEWGRYKFGHLVEERLAVVHKMLAVLEPYQASGGVN